MEFIPDSPILLGFESAVSYWRTLRADNDLKTKLLLESLYDRDRLGSIGDEEIAAESSLIPLDAPKITPRSADALRDQLEIKGHIHLVVGRRNSRRRTAEVCSHIWHGPIPDGLICDLDDGIYVSGPEIIFMQMASVLDPIELMQLGYELCGSYACSPVPGNPARPTHRPVTSVERLRFVCDLCRGITGYKNANRVLKYLANGSRSPMESQVATVLCLPKHAGGLGCNPPLLNHKIYLDDTARAICNKSHLIMDMYFTDVGINFEYKGRGSHEGLEKQISDDLRSNALLHHDIETINLWSRSAYDEAQIRSLVEIVKRRQSRRRQDKREDSAVTKERRRQLLARLRELSLEAFGRQSWIDYGW